MPLIVRRCYGRAVTEEAIIRAVVKALLASLKKKYPDVIDDLRFALGADKDGQDAVFVTVILKDRDRKKGDYRWEDVRPVEHVIRQKVSDKAPVRFPYVGFQLKSELAAGG